MTAWIAPADIMTWLGPDLDLPTATILANSATSAVGNYLQRDLAQQIVTNELHSGLNTEYLLLNCWPITAVAAVVLGAGPPLPPAGWNVAGWKLDQFNSRKLWLLGMGRIPRGELNISVSYTGGYDLTLAQGVAGAIPADVYLALQLTAAAQWNARAADPNLASESTAGVFSGSFYPTGVGAVPPGARSLLGSYVRVAPNL